MEFTHSSLQTKSTNTYQLTSENIPLIRKPLCQITNLPSPQSPALCNSSPASSDSSKASYHSNIFPILKKEPSKSNHHHSGSSENSPPSLAQKPNTFTPSASSTRIMETPSRPRQGHFTHKSFVGYNPFESCAELLQFPTVSPSLFKEVVSPSEKEDGDKDFSWTIDHLALMKPTPIDLSPLRHMDVPVDPEYEKKAQDAIDKFFSSTLVVPSPWTSSNSSRSFKLMPSLFPSGASLSRPDSCLVSSSPALLPSNAKLPKAETSKLSQYEVHTPPHPKTYSVWCQTELTLPPMLPKEVEDVLAPFCTFTKDQFGQHEDADENSALNATSLRRKLLFSDESSSLHKSSEGSPKTASEEGGSASPASTGALPLDEEEASLPWGVSMIRPAAHSPTSLGVGGKRLVDSHVSPISYVDPKGFRTTLSPLSPRVLGSPKLSPILKTPSPLHPPLHRHRGPSSLRPSDPGTGDQLGPRDEGDGGRIKETSPPRSGTSKASPQFSSSPIKRRGAAAAASRRPPEAEPAAGSPPKFSESPPVSPIAWNLEEPRVLSPITEQPARHAHVCHLSFFRPQDASTADGEGMEDLEEEEGKKRSSSGQSRVGDSAATLWRSAKERTWIGAPVASISTHMDTDSAPFFEGSTLDEGSMSCQDTGYYTGSSLQTTNVTNQSNFILGNNHTRELKSSISLSPQETEVKFEFFSADEVACCDVQFKAQTSLD